MWSIAKKKKASPIQHLFLSSLLPIPDLFTSISDNLYTSMLQGLCFCVKNLYKWGSMITRRKKWNYCQMRKEIEPKELLFFFIDLVLFPFITKDKNVILKLLCSFAWYIGFHMVGISVGICWFTLAEVLAAYLNVILLCYLGRDIMFLCFSCDLVSSAKLKFRCHSGRGYWWEMFEL